MGVWKGAPRPQACWDRTTAAQPDGLKARPRWKLGFFCLRSCFQSLPRILPDSPGSRRPGCPCTRWGMVHLKIQWGLNLSLPLKKRPSWAVTLVSRARGCPMCLCVTERARARQLFSHRKYGSWFQPLGHPKFLRDGGRAVRPFPGEHSSLL